MGTLYVDVDDTLVDWSLDDKKNVVMTPNERVILAIRQHMHEFFELIIWSGGGGDYAFNIWHHPKVQALAGDIQPTGYMSKFWLRQGTFGDVFIDDSPFEEWADRAIHPRDLPYLRYPTMRQGVA